MSHQLRMHTNWSIFSLPPIHSGLHSGRRGRAFPKYKAIEWCCPGFQQVGAAWRQILCWNQGIRHHQVTSGGERCHFHLGHSLYDMRFVAKRTIKRDLYVAVSPNPETLGGCIGPFIFGVVPPQELEFLFLCMEVCFMVHLNWETNVSIGQIHRGCSWNCSKKINSHYW